MSNEDKVEVESGAGEDVKHGLTTEDLMNNPELLAAVQEKLTGLVGSGSGYLEALPQCIKNRINALKNIQVEFAKIEGKFYEEAHMLEMKYADLYKPLYEKRKDIVNGTYEPTEVEATWVDIANDEDDEEEEKIKELPKSEKSDEEKLADEVLKKMNVDENTKGIPEFWLTAMKNVEIFAEMIQEQDENILKHLTDIQLIFTGKKQVEDEDSELGFVLEFLFSKNEYFSNSALTKTYKMKSEPDADDPFSFEGPDIVSCSGCKIDWYPGKNVTQKQVKKKQKHKGRGQTRIVTKTVQNDSFFNFFDPPEAPEDEEEMDEETEGILSADFEIGHFFRERLIPKAVLFFTGEAIEEESDDSDDEYEDEEDEDNDDEDEDNDPDYKPETGTGEKPQECKQQ